MDKLITLTLAGTRLDAAPAANSEQTRLIYDRLATIYPLSTFFFHSRAHAHAVDAAGIRDGMSVLEVATGSGEMFRRLVARNPNGATIGIDLSPNMAARTQRMARRRFPYARTHCKAVDARHMPFRDDSFDALVCCYLFELLAAEDIELTLREFRRVLRHRGTFALVMIGQNVEFFNQLYKVANRVAPAFWGRQVEHRVPELIQSSEFRILSDRTLRQSGYPSRVLVARK